MASIMVLAWGWMCVHFLAMLAAVAVAVVVVNRGRGKVK